ncbi:MAG: hypothetical protein WC785_07425 [Tatlockia sp.]|jgi:hypothetical protein
MGPYLHALLSRNSQFAENELRFNQEAIALLLKYQLKTKKKQVFVLAGSEDLYALLPNLRLEKEGEEAFLLIRPYIHSMGLYLYRSKESLVCFLFDAQNWGLRYYPTRLILAAIQSHFPSAQIHLTNTLFQPQTHQKGCVQYSIAFLAYCSEYPFHLEWQGFERQLSNGSEYYQLMDLPPLLKNQLNERPRITEDKDRYFLEEILESMYSLNGALDWTKIDSLVEEMQGLPLLDTSTASYKTLVNKQQKSICFQFDNKAFIFGNFFTFSSELFPLEAKDNFEILLQDNESLTIEIDRENYRIRYSAEDLQTLKNAFCRIDKSYYWKKNLRQQTALKALGQQVQFAMELDAVCQNTNGGFDQHQVQSALQYYFAEKSGILVPSIASYETLNDSNFSLLKQQGMKVIVFSHQVNFEHQVAVWLDLEQTPYHAKVFDSLDTKGFKEELTYFLGLTDKTLVVNKAKSPFPPQRNNWSCGVYVIAHLLFEGNLLPDMPFNLEAMAQRYLSIAFLQENRAKHATVLGQTMQILLDKVKKKPSPLFDVLRNFLTEKCLIMQRVNASQESILQAYKSLKDKQGMLLLETAFLLQNALSANSLACLIQVIIHNANLLKKIPSQTNTRRYSNAETCVFITALESEVGLISDYSTLLNVLKALLTTPFSIQKCLALIEVEYPIPSGCNLSELQLALIEETVNALTKLDQSLLAEVQRKNQKYSQLRQSILDSASIRIKPYLTSEEYTVFIHNLFEDKCQFEAFHQVVCALPDEQLAKVLPFNSNTHEEYALWYRLVENPDAFIQSLTVLPKTILLKVARSTNGRNLPFLHKASEMPASFAAILQRLSEKERRLLFQKKDALGNTVFHHISAESLQIALAYLTKQQLKGLISIENYSEQTLFHTNKSAQVKNRIWHYLAQHTQWNTTDSKLYKTGADLGLAQPKNCARIYIEQLYNANKALSQAIDAFIESHSGVAYTKIEEMWALQKEQIHTLNSHLAIHYYFPLQENELKLLILQRTLQRDNACDVIDAAGSLSTNLDEKNTLLVAIFFALEETREPILNACPLLIGSLLKYAIAEKHSLFAQLLQRAADYKPLVFSLLHEAIALNTLTVHELLYSLQLFPKENSWLLSVFKYKIFVADPLLLTLEEKIPFVLLNTNSPYLQLTNLFSGNMAITKGTLDTIRNVIKQKLETNHLEKNEVLDALLQINYADLKRKDIVSSVLHEAISDEKKLAKLMVYFNCLRTNGSVPYEQMIKAALQLLDVIDEDAVKQFKTFKLRAEVQPFVTQIHSRFVRHAIRACSCEAIYLGTRKALQEYTRQLLFLYQVSNSNEAFNLWIKLSSAVINLSLLNDKDFDLGIYLIESTAILKGKDNETVKTNILLRALHFAKEELFEVFFDCLAGLKKNSVFYENLLIPSLRSGNYPLANFLINPPGKYSWTMDENTVFTLLDVVLAQRVLKIDAFCAFLIKNLRNNEPFLKHYIRCFSKEDLIHLRKNNQITDAVLLAALSHSSFTMSDSFIRSLATLPVLDEAIHIALSTLFFDAIKGGEFSFCTLLYSNYIVYHKNRFFDKDNQLLAHHLSALKKQEPDYFCHQRLWWWSASVYPVLSSTPSFNAETYKNLVNDLEKHTVLFQISAALGSPEVLMDKSYLQMAIAEYYCRKLGDAFNLEKLLDTMINPNASFSDLVKEKKQILQAMSKTKVANLKKHCAHVLEGKMYSQNNNELISQFFMPHSQQYKADPDNASFTP